MRKLSPFPLVRPPVFVGVSEFVQLKPYIFLFGGLFLFLSFIQAIYLLKSFKELQLVLRHDKVL